jgi:hypothetical protein
MRASDAAPARPPVAIRIRPVSPLAGLSWVRRGARMFARRPGGFLGLFGLAMLAMVLLVALVPSVLLPFALAIAPLVSLGFMVATESVHNDLPIRPGVFVEPLASGPKERSALAQVGLAYVVAAFAVLMIVQWIDGGELLRWFAAMRTTVPDSSTPVPNPISERGATALVVGTGLVALVSIPLWYAPALVHWGRQRAPQAMFSSIVALWRTRGAFVVYLLGWWLLSAVVSFVGTLLAAVIGNPQFEAILMFMVEWVLTAVFYVTLWYGFEDTFEIRPLDEPDAPAPYGSDRAG